VARSNDPTPSTIAVIILSGLGFMLVGSWFGEKTSYTGLLMVFGIAFIISAIGFAIVSNVKSQNQSVHDTK